MLLVSLAWASGPMVRFIINDLQFSPSLWVWYEGFQRFNPIKIFSSRSHTNGLCLIQNKIKKWVRRSLAWASSRCQWCWHQHQLQDHGIWFLRLFRFWTRKRVLTAANYMASQKEIHTDPPMPTTPHIALAVSKQLPLLLTIISWILNRLCSTVLCTRPLIQVLLC